jgi:hypothetical protein
VQPCIQVYQVTAQGNRPTEQALQLRTQLELKNSRRNSAAISGDYGGCQHCPGVPWLLPLVGLLLLGGRSVIAKYQQLPLLPGRLRVAQVLQEAVVLPVEQRAEAATRHSEAGVTEMTERTTVTMMMEAVGMMAALAVAVARQGPGPVLPEAPRLVVLAVSGVQGATAMAAAQGAAVPVDCLAALAARGQRDRVKAAAGRCLGAVLPD